MTDGVLLERRLGFVEIRFQGQEVKPACCSAVPIPPGPPLPPNAMTFNTTPPRGLSRAVASLQLIDIQGSGVLVTSLGTQYTFDELRAIITEGRSIDVGSTYTLYSSDITFFIMGPASTPVISVTIGNSLPSLVALSLVGSDNSIFTAIDFSLLSHLNNFTADGGDFREFDMSKLPPSLEILSISGLLPSALVLNLSTIMSLTYHDKAITSIDVGGCTVLESLDVSGCGLSTLDVGDNAALRSLTCSYNQIYELVLPSQIESLYCAGNALPNIMAPPGLVILDCNGNSQLTSMNFTEARSIGVINCSGCALATLEVPSTVIDLNASNNKLTSIKFEDPQNLISLNISANLLDPVDTPDAPSLTNLTCGGNPINGLTIVRDVNPSIQMLDVANTPTLSSLSYTYASSDIARARRIPKVKRKTVARTEGEVVDIGGDKCIVSGCDQLTKINVNGWSNLSTLDVSSNSNLDELSIDFTSATSTLSNLASNVNLTKLSAQSCYRYGSEEAALRYLDLTANTALEHLDLYDSFLETLVLPPDAPLRYLDIGYGAFATFPVISNTALITLLCDDNLFTDVALSTDSLHLHSLESVDIKYSSFLQTLSITGGSPEDCGKLTRLNITGCPSLTTLDCYYNALTTLDLIDNTSLTALNCSYNNISSITGITAQHAIRSIMADHCDFSEETVNALAADLAAIGDVAGQEAMLCILTQGSTTIPSDLESLNTLRGLGWTIE